MRCSSLILFVVITTTNVALTQADDGPVAVWKLSGDAKNAVKNSPQGENHGVTFDTVMGKSAGAFDGRGDRIAVPANDSLKLGRDDFTISLWVNTAASDDDDLGDLVSQFNSNTRTGFHLSLRNNAGVTHCLANYRQLQFGIDAGTEPVFTDEGRPGNSVFGQSMAVHRGQLFVGTCEAGPDQAGHVFRYDGTGRWIDLGSPDKANSVTAMATYDGSLFVGSGKYRLGGSALSESENPNRGGRVFRYADDGKWEEIGHFPEMEAVGGMVGYRGKLHVSSLYKPAAFFRYEGGAAWTALDVPNGKRVEALSVFNGSLWATGYDEGHVYRYDGERWTDLGNVGEVDSTTQTYAFATYRGQLQVATWRMGKVFAWDKDTWQDRGRLGEELEVMGMLVHNGSFYGGTLPLGQIYRYDGGQTWTLLKQLDTTPDVKYRRVWAMAQHQGKLFATTLPSGHIWSMQTGAAISWDEEFPAGWHHVAAQRQGESLRLFVDGKAAVEVKSAKAKALDLTTDQPWLIGAGSGDYFHGSLADLQVHRRALSAEEIRALAK